MSQIMCFALSRYILLFCALPCYACYAMLDPLKHVFETGNDRQSGAPARPSPAPPAGNPVGLSRQTIRPLLDVEAPSMGLCAWLGVIAGIECRYTHFLDLDSRTLDPACGLIFECLSAYVLAS